MFCTVHSVKFYHVSGVLHNVWKDSGVFFLWRMMICDVVSVYWRIHCTFSSGSVLVLELLVWQINASLEHWKVMVLEVGANWGADGEPVAILHGRGWQFMPMLPCNLSALPSLGSLMPLASFSHRNKHFRGVYLDMWNIIFLLSRSDFLLNLCFYEFSETYQWDSTVFSHSKFPGLMIFL